MIDLDLLLAGARVIDPLSGRDGIADVAIAGGTIAEVSSGIDRSRARRVVDVSGLLVTPGLVDLHSHVLSGVIETAADADEVGVRSGVTTLVDAGSAGPSTIGAFVHHVMPNSATRILPFMHIAKTGLATRPDIAAATDVDFAMVEDALEQYSGLIGGLKVRMVNPALSILGTEMLRRAVDIAHAAGLPVMVHIGDLLQQAGPDLGPKTLELLGEGDIVTHVFTPHPGGVLDDRGTVFPEVFAAVQRGVLFDSAHGVRNFSFDVARRVLDQEVPLDSISTDMTHAGRSNVVFSLTEVMSRFLALGLSVAEVIARTTAKPAAAARIAGIGSLTPGQVADVSVLELRGGDWQVSDSVGAHLALSQLFVPRLTVRAGEVITPSWGPHPGGWEPESGAGTVSGGRDAGEHPEPSETTR